MGRPLKVPWCNIAHALRKCDRFYGIVTYFDATRLLCDTVSHVLSVAVGLRNFFQPDIVPYKFT